MSATAGVLAFVAGALISLGTSLVLISRLERVGERLGLSEALLGLIAALAADAPEITAAVSAILGHQQRLGAGVIIGSNVFNLAALLGLGAVVARRIELHRKVVLLGGAVAVVIAGLCVAVVAGPIPPVSGALAGVLIVGAYALVLGAGPGVLARLPLPLAWLDWLEFAVSEEEIELEDAIRPRRGRWPDAVLAVAALVVVVAASVAMERAASALGSRYAVPEIIVGGLVLAAVTSLPNAVAAIYLAARGRGAATLSTALNSNTLNVVFGLLLPAALIGLSPASEQATLIVAWYIGMTVIVLGMAYLDRGLRRPAGVLVIVAYAVFTWSLFLPETAVRLQVWLAAAMAAVFAAGGMLGWIFPPRDPGKAGPIP